MCATMSVQHTPVAKADNAAGVKADDSAAVRTKASKVSTRVDGEAYLLRDETAGFFSPIDRKNLNPERANSQFHNTDTTPFHNPLRATE